MGFSLGPPPCRHPPSLVVSYLGRPVGKAFTTTAGHPGLAGLTHAGDTPSRYIPNNQRRDDQAKIKKLEENVGGMKAAEDSARKELAQIDLTIRGEYGGHTPAFAFTRLSCSNYPIRL